MKKYSVAVVALLSCLAASVHGSGFALMEQSAAGVGRSHAGSAAGADIESSIYYNPAGIAGADGASAALGAHLLLVRVDFDGSARSPGGIPISGGDGGDAGDTAVLPNLYLVQPLTDDIVVGLGVFVPFGLSTEYDDGWMGRYHALETSLETLDINPTIAWQITKKLAVGAGVSAQRAEATLSSAVDFGTIAGIAPGLMDGAARVNADDWDYGFDVGLIYRFTDATRLGFSYRSAIKHELSGKAHFDVPAPAAGIQALGMFVDTDGSATLEVPASASFGGVQKIGDKLALMCGLVWTEWSSFDELRIDYASSQPDTVTDESWNDVWFVSFGGEYYLSDKWVLRAGTAYDESPVPDSEHRTPRLPDADRIWLSLGLGCQTTEHSVLDMGYAHIFFDDPGIVRSATGDELIGDYYGGVDIISVQLKWEI